MYRLCMHDLYLQQQRSIEMDSQFFCWHFLQFQLVLILSFDATDKVKRRESVNLLQMQRTRINKLPAKNAFV
jgi:hypothetical protein